MKFIKNNNRQIKLKAFRSVDFEQLLEFFVVSQVGDKFNFYELLITFRLLRLIKTLVEGSVSDIRDSSHSTTGLFLAFVSDA